MFRRYLVYAFVACVAAGMAAGASAHAQGASGSASSSPSLRLSGSGSEFGAATLSLRATLALHSSLGACASPLPDGVSDCARRTISGPFPGLGHVTSTYEFILNRVAPPCATGSGRALSYPIRLSVASKGEIQLTVAEASECISEDVLFNQSQRFTITGGTGVYAGASGSGTLERALGTATDSGRSGTETWSGTVAVPGLEFDTTAPTLSGATAKTVRAKKGAKSARVVFTVSAQDDRDPSVAVTCAPRSGSRFSLGRTRVQCNAFDTSGNSATATFAITVKRAR